MAGAGRCVVVSGPLSPISSPDILTRPQHYSTSHTVCPEDVLLLTYPLGDLLNTTAAVSRADADLFIPITCRENAGMTTPIHTVVWLGLGEWALAQAEFNRSMHAACYGPFNVRNEVRHERGSRG